MIRAGKRARSGIARAICHPYSATVFDISADMPYNMPLDAGELGSGSCVVCTMLTAPQMPGPDR